jgi:hypothetical protein
MTLQSSQDSLSHEARELLANLNGLAAQIMCEHYEDLTVGMRLRVTNVIKNTKQILDGDPIRKS